MPNKIATRLTLADLRSRVFEVDDAHERMTRITATATEAIARLDPRLPQRDKDDEIRKIRAEATSQYRAKLLSTVHELKTVISAQGAHFDRLSVMQRAPALDSQTRKPIRDSNADATMKDRYVNEARSMGVGQLLVVAERAVADGNAAQFSAVRNELLNRPSKDISSHDRIQVGFMMRQIELPESVEGLELIYKATKKLEEIESKAFEVMTGKADSATRIRLGLRQQEHDQPQEA